jgi:hypothetical protein
VATSTPAPATRCSAARTRRAAPSTRRSRFTSESTTTAYDFFYVEVRSTTGTLLGTLGSFSNRNASAYTQRSFSLAAWRGQTVRLQFRATTDVILPTTFRVDDVSLS